MSARVRCDGYVRVSRVGGRGGESFISPSEQSERIRAWAKARGFDLVKIHTDLDQPGSTAQRPGLQAAIERIERGTVSGLIVWRLDRFGRSAVDNSRLLERIRAAGGVLYTVTEGIDTSGPMGEFLANVFTAFAQLELARIRDGWSAARERAVGRGVHIASKVPTGYRRRADGRLEPSQDAAAIAEVFGAKARGEPWSALAAILEGAGVRTPYGGVRWAQRSLTHLISNRVYLGEARSGEFVHPGAHEPLIDAETWELAQRTKQPRSEGRGGALLSGLLRCAGCRYVLKADHMRDRGGEKLRLYRCRIDRAAGGCPAPASVLGRVVEPWVIKRFFEEAEAPRVLVDDRHASDARRELLEALEHAEAELDAYRDTGAAAILGAERFEAGLRGRAQRVQDAAEALAGAEQPGVDLPDVAELRASWGELTVAERRHILTAAVDAVFLRRTGQVSVPIADRALICFRGEGPDDLPGPGRRGVGIRSFDW